MSQSHWSPEDDLCGIPTIDRQHQRLETWICLARELAMSGEIPETLDLLLENIVYAVDDHFFYEEYLMSRHGYAEIEAHRQVHDQGRQRVMEIYQIYREAKDDREVLALVTTDFLSDWLGAHLKEHDAALTEFLRSHWSEVLK